MTKVIFACIHNTGPSQMAAAFFNAMADPLRAIAISAGTQPGERVHPEVVATMREAGINLSGATPSRLTFELAEGATLLVTMGCGDEFPVIPVALREDWPVSDTRGQPVACIREIRDEIKRRVATLVSSEGWLLNGV